MQTVATPPRAPLAPANVADKATPERILSLRVWSEKLLSFRLSRPAAFRFAPGQFARLGVASGQGGIVWRPYSMVSAVYDDYLEFFSILIPDGAFTSRLAALGVGDTVHVEKQVYGYLTTSRFVGGQDLWLLATGTGIAPFVSILRDPQVWTAYENLIVAYSVREARDLAYRDEILALRDDPLFADMAHKLRFVPVVTREALPDVLHERLPVLVGNGALEAAAGLPLDPVRARILMCGNPQMLDDLRDALQRRGLQPDRGRAPGNFASENYW